jgi:ABC-2 type transport system permease protein
VTPGPRIRLLWRLTLASTKMYLRQREAILWSIVLPLFVIVLFGLVDFDGSTHVNLGVVNDAGSAADPLINSLQQIDAIRMTRGGAAEEVEAMARGERDMLLFIGKGYAAGSPAGLAVNVDSAAKPRETQLGLILLQAASDRLSAAGGTAAPAEWPPAAGSAGIAPNAPPVRPAISISSVRSRTIRYIDFLLPGMISLSIMQLGIFGVAFGFVSLKRRGILRRLSVTPMRPSDFIIAQVATRVFALTLQMGFLLLAGVMFFGMRIEGNIALMGILAALGAVVFLSIGFALAGVSKSEDQVAPLANIISVPMMVLSGVFFSRSNLPGILRAITDYFPLTFLADGMRAVAIEGATFAQVLPQIGGLVVWGFIAVAVAARLFRWE